MALENNSSRTDEHYNISPINICQEKYFLLLYPSKCIIFLPKAVSRKDRNLRTFGQTENPALGRDVPRPVSTGMGQGGFTPKRHVSHQRDFGAFLVFDL